MTRKKASGAGLRIPQGRVPIRSDDGQIEIDALAEGDKDANERWAVEIKWRGKLDGVKEVQRLLAAAGTLRARPWFISRAGFMPEAEALAWREGVMTSGREEMERLVEAVRRS